jgi:putative ABC transport system permease protein
MAFPTGSGRLWKWTVERFVSLRDRPSTGSQTLLAKSARRFQTQALVIFAALALAFAAVGLYAALTYQVTLRRREIGIRTALGAGRRDIIGLFVRGGAALTFAGTAIGIAGAILTALVVQSLLYETAPLDPRAYLAAVAAVAAVSMLAAALPARQASRVDPLIILKDG